MFWLNFLKSMNQKDRGQTSEDPIPPCEVVDLFCGVGALSYGLKRAGLEIVAGYDVDARCKHAFERNNDAEFYARDVAKLTAKEVKHHFSGKGPTVIAGCAPCQPFSTYKHRYEEDPQWSLVTKFAKLAVEIEPDFVTMENVPTLLKYKKGRVFQEFCEHLTKANYQLNWKIAKCEEFGVPQKRRRLVVIASKSTVIRPLKPSASKVLSVRDAIGSLPMLKAGETDPTDPLHTASSLTDINLRRIRASRPGGTWRDWPEELRAPCHRRPTGKTYPGVYARMSWDEAFSDNNYTVLRLWKWSLWSSRARSRNFSERGSPLAVVPARL